jgi:hypothetical protein
LAVDTGRVVGAHTTDASAAIITAALAFTIWCAPLLFTRNGVRAGGVHTLLIAVVKPLVFTPATAVVAVDGLNGVVFAPRQHQPIAAALVGESLARIRFGDAGEHLRADEIVSTATARAATTITPALFSFAGWLTDLALTTVGADRAVVTCAT